MSARLAIASELMELDQLRLDDGSWVTVTDVERTGRDGRLAIFFRREDGSTGRVTRRDSDEVYYR